jgi:hypothetical protein
LNTSRQTLRLFAGLLLAAVFFSCLFSWLLPTSASFLSPTATLTRTAIPTPTVTPTSTITVTPTVTLIPTITVTPTVTVTHLPAHLITPNVTQFTTYSVYFQRELWESVTGNFLGIEDFEREPFDYAELNFPYLTGNRLILTGTSTAQILLAPELLDSGNLIHFRDFEQGLTFTFPNDANVTAFGFDYTSSEDWLLTFNQILTPLPRGRNRFVGIVLNQDMITQFTLSGPQTAQGGLSVDNIVYFRPWVPSTSTSTPTQESGTP